MKFNLSLIFSFFLVIISLFTVYTSMDYFVNCKTLMIEMDILNQINSVVFSYLILLDWVSLLFMATVSLISGVVMLYSYSYMMSDPNKNGFFLLVLMFVGSMFLMVMSPQMLSILLGWDGLGLVSYCLVIYYNNYKSQNAGMVTFLSNRIGDLGIIVTISWLMNYGSMSVFFFQNIYSFNSAYLFYMIVLAAMTKSAQVPFSAWLPAAMAAPTPVSSLVHSSTLVTAGVYLLIRFNFLVNLNFYLLVFSTLTMLMSGVSALFESDLKKVIALSTLSQLGVMMFALSVGLKELAFFHLISHALFKSLLFLCAGFYIHSNFDWQDIRSFNRIYSLFPSISFYFTSASLALSGFPFLSGFYSKDAIIEMFFSDKMNSFMFLLLLLATCLTLIYSIRLIYMTFMNTNITNPPLNSSEEDFIMVSPMLILFIFSVSGGSMMSWIYFPSIFISLSVLVKMLVLLILLSLFLVMAFSKEMFFKTTKGVIIFLANMWLIPLLTLSFFSFFMNKSLLMIKMMDQGWLEFFGGQGLYSSIQNKSFKLDLSHVINIKTLLSVMGITLILFVML